MKDWVQAAGQRNPALLGSPIEVSVERRLITCAAERIRLQRTIEAVHP